MERYREIEKSIIKKYRKEIWSKFVKAVKEYELIKENDKIMVCISGGKDSFLLAKCMEELSRHGKFKFELHFVVMNPGYNEKNLEYIKKNAEILNLDIEIFNSDIFEVTDRISKENPCYLCARMRRGCLYNKARELGCNKIALGHHFNDVIETTLLSMFYGAEIKTMMPKLHSDNFEGIELIRPLYLVREKDIISWSKYNDLHFLNCACRFTEKSEANEELSKRREMKRLIEELLKKNKNIDYNIFKSTSNVNLDTVIAYKKDKVMYHFLEEYDKKEIKEEDIMKRKIVILGMLFISLFMILACTNKKSDALKFKEEYEILNKTIREKDGKTIRSIKISKNNPFIYKSDQDIVDAINNKESFIVYFGFNDCPWCRSVLPLLIEAAEDNDIKEIYYVDVKDIRDVMVIKDSRLTTETKGTDAYYELTNLLSNVLGDYEITDEQGEKINTGAKRIYAPNIIKVEKGIATKIEEGISEKQTDAYMELTKEIKKDTYNKFNEFFK